MILNEITKDNSSSLGITNGTRLQEFVSLCSDQYPDGKPIDPSDTLAEPNEKGEWVCVAIGNWQLQNIGAQQKKDASARTTT